MSMREIRYGFASTDQRDKPARDRRIAKCETIKLDFVLSIKILYVPRIWKQ